MFSQVSLSVSQLLLISMGVQMRVFHRQRIPDEATAVVVVSNHRSFMDALVLMAALQRPLHVVCHHYMSQTPVLREMVDLLGCIPLDAKGQQQRGFFQQATQLLQAREWVGIFPEGGQPMVELTQPQEISLFERGFAHLALRVGVPNLAVLPVAIASISESVHSPFPIRLLHWVDPSEPLFERSGLHPIAIYHRVKVSIGHPYWITERQRQQYQGKGAKNAVTELTQYCRQQILDLLHSN